MFRALLTILLVCISLLPAHAISIWDATHRADLVCIATFESERAVESEHPLAFEGNVIYAFTMNVSQVWKGEVKEKKLTLHLARYERNGPWQPFRPFETNRNYLIIAKRNPKGRFYTSPDDLNGKQGFVDYFPVRESVPAVPSQPLMVRVTRQIIANLLDANTELKQKSLWQLQDYEGVFIDDSTWVKKQFGAAEVSATKSLVKKEAIPEILRLTREGDEEIRCTALETASWLQQTSVIPQLARGAQSGKPWADSLAWGFLHYRNREALPLLQAQLSNTNPIARLAIIEAFELFRDPATIPDLKRLLTDPDAQVRDRARYAVGLIGG
ncbi:HEAT repeat domain-containing protein [bacterium]|nr:MAG: HEAT repeat domain-containing protein [bacterium]